MVHFPRSKIILRGPHTHRIRSSERLRMLVRSTACAKSFKMKDCAQSKILQGPFPPFDFDHIYKD